MEDRKTHICRLKKALYGLKQAPRAWYAHIDSYLMKLGFTRSNVDPSLYFKVVQSMPFILVPYVDDLFFIGSEPLMIKCKRKLAFEFDMKDQWVETLNIMGEGDIYQENYKNIIDLCINYSRGSTRLKPVGCDASPRDSNA